MEGSSLFNPGFLGSAFLWWVGQIADDSVPGEITLVREIMRIKMMFLDGVEDIK